MAVSTNKRLGDFLIEQGLLTQEQLDDGLKGARRDGQTLQQNLLKLGFVTEEDIAVALAEQLGYPLLRIDNYNIPPEVVEYVPESLARQHHLIPISQTGNTLTIAMSDPLNIMSIDDIRMWSGHEIEIIVALRSEISRAIDKYYGGQNVDTQEVFDDLISEQEGEDLALVETEDEMDDIANLRNEAEEAPVIRLVNLVLAEALNAGASDIHIEPYEKSVRIRNRIDGILQEGKSPPKKVQSALASRMKIMADLDIAEHRVPQDGRFRIKFKGREIDFRMSTLPTQYGEKIVLRILDKSNLTLDLEGMGFEEQPLKAFTEALKEPHGMVLVTGPTGSGKTTTLYSALQALNTIESNLVTVEDPVEYDLVGINQVQTHAEIGLTFAAGLRSILRQDPDIVMVGEIRDEETADIAVKAALTGHLVLSTLHTNNAAGVPPRLIDMGVEPFLVSSSLLLASAQRLLRRLCKHCKEPAKIDQETLDRAASKAPEGIEKTTFYRGRGCKKCNKRGYKGRLAVIETMVNNDEIRQLIMERSSGGTIKSAAIDAGMRTLRQNALAKAIKGLTSLEEVLRVTAPD